MNEVKEHLSYFTTRQARAKVSGPDEVAPLLSGADGGGCVSPRVTCTFFVGTQMASCRMGGIVLGAVRLSAIGFTLASSCPVQTLKEAGEKTCFAVQASE